ncbi:MAG: DUF4347 domain-containing protein, partial [Cyanobacteria bacterium J06632_22]
MNSNPADFTASQDPSLQNVFTGGALYSGDSVVESESRAQSRSIAFVDAGLSSVDELMLGLEGSQIVLIDTARDGIAQITSTLAEYEDLEAVHIFSHGTDGLLQLGDTILSNQTVEGYGESLQQWAASLTAEADLMIYGCNLAAGSAGLSLVDRLGELTGADVAASDDMTGADGDWQLEVSTGAI